MKINQHWDELHKDVSGLAKTSPTDEGRRLAHSMLRIIEIIRDGAPKSELPTGHHT